jgi:hypothetical protein
MLYYSYLVLLFASCVICVDACVVCYDLVYSVSYTWWTQKQIFEGREEGYTFKLKVRQMVSLK